MFDMKSLPIGSESTRRRNPHLYGYNEKVAKFGQGYVSEFCGPKPLKRIRQSSKPLLNKLEQEWLAHQKAFFPSAIIHAQAIKFRLGNGTTYSPDFVCFDWECGDHGRVACWEIKGPWFPDDAKVKLKLFAYQYPEIWVRLCWKENDRWVEQEVLA